MDMNTLVDNGGELLLFPFLVTEAKQEEGKDTFGTAQSQTAFPIKKLLTQQQQLNDLTGNETTAPGGPLVWFLASVGADWRVYAAFVSVKEDEPSYVSRYLPHHH